MAYRSVVSKVAIEGLSAEGVPCGMGTGFKIGNLSKMQSNLRKRESTSRRNFVARGGLWLFFDKRG